MASHNGELRILSVYGKGEGPLAVDGHDTLFTASEVEALNSLQALGHAVVRRRRAQGLDFRRGDEGIMTVHRQWALPFSVDAQDPQLSVVTGHAGGARGVHMQIL